MSTNVPTTEAHVIVRYDPDQAPAIAYHREGGQLVVTFGPAQTSVEHLLMVLRREVEPATSGAFPDALLDADTDGGAPEVDQLDADQREGDRRRGER